MGIWPVSRAALGLRCALAALVVAPSLLADELPFSELPYQEARVAALSQGRLFVVDATAAWCPPCRKMERESWPDAAVGAWLKANAVAVQLDVDEEPAIARELGIEAMPTLIVFRGEKEVERHVGFMPAEALLTWLVGAASGTSSKRTLLQRAVALMQSGDIDERYDVARDLLRERQYELALQHYLWLWPGTRRSVGYAGVRVSFMLSDMKHLADRDQDAREAFDALFDEVKAKVIDSPSPDRIE